MIVSIHPMLLFIIEQSLADLVIPVCQYIPCYCSSVGPVGTDGMYITCQYIPCYCSSQCRELGLDPEDKCQYIPCYCSSSSTCNSSTAQKTCQYIPCYCSSALVLIFVIIGIVSIHPMLLFIVFSGTSEGYAIIVSIHPMLLFIQRF